MPAARSMRSRARHREARVQHDGLACVPGTSGTRQHMERWRHHRQARCAVNDPRAARFPQDRPNKKVPTMTNRRDFLRDAAAIAAIAPFAVLPVFAAPPQKLRILIMGGTGFLGPHVVETATRRGHTLTLFNRGKTHPGLFPDIEQLHGDRKSDMKALEGRSWDAVVDTSAYIPADVTRSATLLGPNVGQYLLISTVSVYAKLDKPGMDESAPLATTDAPDADKVTNENYGALKALCEKAAEKSAPGKVTVIRPGLIVGPGDSTDRFTYWPVRVARGGEVLAPGSPKDFTQFIDARDLAEFIVLC